MSAVSVVAAFVRRDWETDISYRTAFGLQAVAVFISLAVFFYLSKVVDPAKLGAQPGLEGGYFGLFASLGIAVAAFTVVFKRSAGLLGLLVAALALLGGVYFPIEVLPAPIEAIGRALPFTWGLDTARAALLGGDVDGAKLAGLFGSVAVLLPLALLAFRVSVSWARRVGSLGQY